ncbi:MAG: hypothetical protein JWM99_4317, partial [Verrucomicrobiales bacterium]|nr:hypothetical protein [Verrucomicrobiales bacterium]
MQSDATITDTSSKSPIRSIALIVFVVFINLLLFEGLSQAYLRFVSNMPNYDLLFQTHPFLAGVPKPGISAGRSGIRISHNTSGFRGAEIKDPEPPGNIRIVTIGGSSTYCVSVTDSATWP